jgi:magnesium-transporting ATPase (P-type)
MRYLPLAAKLVALTIILVALSGIGSAFLPVIEPPGDAVQQPAPLSLVFVIFFLQALAISIPVLWSRWTGWRLAAAIFVVYFGTVTVVTQIESLVYLGDKMPAELLAGLLAMGCFVAVVFAPLCVLILGRWKSRAAIDDEQAPVLNLGRWGWRVAVAGLVFLCLYYLFGYYVAWQDPELRAYYGGTDPGSFLAQMKSVARDTPWMIPLQYVRGSLYVGLGLLVIVTMRGPWWRAGLAMAMLLAVPTLYLLLPNPVMPDFPRITHLVETLPYQFLFGWFLAWFLVARA